MTLWFVSEFSALGISTFYFITFLRSEKIICPPSGTLFNSRKKQGLLLFTLPRGQIAGV